MTDEIAMREQIIDICLEAMLRQGIAGAERMTIFREPGHARAFLALLRDCRPLPVIRALIAEVGPAASRHVP